jgi:exonuclease SbcC
MILTRLQLSNYKQYRHLDLEFKEGLVGVIGKNGAGKSTIFEAILYCLFGKDDSNKVHVRSSFATDPKASVVLELSFNIGSVTYRVNREFRGKALAPGAELFKNDLQIAKGVSAVNEELVQIMHLERDAFKRSVFSGQKELSELSDTTGEARKKMVRKMLGLDNLDDIQTRVNTDTRDLNNQIVGQRHNLLSDEATQTLEQDARTTQLALQEKRAAHQQEIARLSTIEAEYQVKKQVFEREAQRLQQQHGLERELAQADERLTGLQQQEQFLLLKINQLQEQKERIDAERTTFVQFERDKKQLLEFEDQRQKQTNKDAVLLRITGHKKQVQELEVVLAQLAEELSGKSETDQALAAKQQAILALEAEMEVKRNELRELDKHIGGINANIREREEKLVSLRAIGQEGTCPTCLQPLLEGYERVILTLEKEVSAYQTEALQAFERQKMAVTEAGIRLKTQQSALRLEADTLLAAQSRLTEVSRQQQAELVHLQRLNASLIQDELILREIGEVHFDDQRYSDLKARYTQLEPAYLEFQKADNYLQQELPAALKNQQATQQALATCRELLAAKRSAISQLNYQESAYIAAKEAFTGYDETLTKQSGMVRQLEKEVLELENEWQRTTDKIAANEAIKTQISDKLLEIDLLRKLSEHLGHFKTEILEKVSPGISKEASQLFSRITKGKYESILVDENFDFAIADGGQYFPINRFSGGEVDLANFCLRIAVTKAIMDLSGGDHRLEFLAFDEIFGSQDEDRRMEMMLALHYLQEQFRQIYIVSHIDSLKDYFPHLLEVQFSAEGSSAVWR